MPESSFTEVRTALPVIECFSKRLGKFLSAENLKSNTSESILSKVETEKGIWLLKGHSPGTTDKQIRSEHTVATALADNGLRLAVPFLPSNDGLPYTRHSDRYWTVTRYLDDDPRYDWTRPTWSSETCASAAAGLAQLHLAGYRLLRRSSNIRSEFSPNQINTFTSKFDEAVKQLEQGSGLAAASLKEFTESTSWLREEVSTTVQQLEDPDYEHAPHTVLHGDYHAGNTLFQGDRLVGIVDLHYVHLGSPVYDLGYATVMFGTDWLRNDHDNQGGSPALPEFQAAFVMAYRKTVRQIGAEPAWLAAVNDSALLHKYMKLACFLIMHWAMEPTSSEEHLKTRNRVYLNALSLLRQMDEH
jgi:Ser/Thr protein kinase RdoA (MazF antagonist)